MKDRKIIFAGAIFLVGIIFAAMLVWGLTSLWSKSHKDGAVTAPDVSDAENKLPEITLKPSFYEEEALKKAIIEGDKKEELPNVRALISPHHFLAADMIASIIAEASGRPIGRIIIIGPNHGHIGIEAFATTEASWETPFGWLDTDRSSVRGFMDDFNLSSNLSAFEDEHAVGSITVIAKKYLPEAELLPILINPSAGGESAHRLSDWLSANVKNDDLVIFSMDFSHYLSESQASKNDERTKGLIENRDVGEIFGLNDDYVDSPISLATALLFAQKNNLRTEFAGNGNSFDLSPSKSDSTTSYFTIRFLE